MTATRIALLLSPRDLEPIRAAGPDLILIGVGVSLAEEYVTASTGIPAQNLNRFTDRGGVAPASRTVAEYVRRFLASARSTLPFEAVASQNDLYQYHLRLQYYGLRALEAALEALHPTELLLATPPYRRYWSPVRPAAGAFHAEQRTTATLAVKLCAAMGVSTGFLGGAGWRRHLPVWPQQTVRRLAIGSFKVLQFLAKQRAVGRPRGAPGADGGIVMVVRTDSEVLSAHPITLALRERGIGVEYVRDEILSSKSTAARLDALGEPSTAIGASTGWSGLVKAWFQRARRVNLNVNFAAGDTPRHAADAVLGQPDIWRSMRRRLLDFAFDQRHFAIDLAAYLQARRARGVVTFAHVDQWGPVIAHAAYAEGLPCLAVQNAVQDPEEYPRLYWADEYCVESTYLRDQLVALGYPSERIHATGLPRFVNDLPATLQSADERQSHRTIVVLTQPMYEEYFETILRVAGAFAARHGWQVCVKLHPRQAANSYAGLIAELSAQAQFRVEQQMPLEQVLAATSIVVSVVSSAMLNAIFQGVPTVSLLPVEERHLDLAYTCHPSVVTVQSGPALAASLDELADDFPARFAVFLHERLRYLDVHATIEPTADATRNVVDLIGKVIVCR